MARFLIVPPEQFAEVAQPLGAGHQIGQYQHLMQRVTQEQLDALFEPPAPAVEKVIPGGEEIAPMITIDDFETPLGLGGIIINVGECYE